MVYTSEGFIVAADGRCRNAQTGPIKSDCDQKIFPIANPGRILAYAVQGTTAIDDTQTGKRALDLLLAVKESIGYLDATPSRHDLNWYASRLWPHVQNALLEANKKHDFGPFPALNNDPSLLFQIILCGFYRNKPSYAEIQFAHKDQKIVQPRVNNYGHISPVVTYGSFKVAEQLFKGNYPEFTAFRTPVMNPRNWKNLTLGNGTEIATNYIRACSSDEGRKIDKEVCDGIGGHIHIAEITPTEFRWRIPPEEKATQERN